MNSKTSPEPKNEKDGGPPNGTHPQEIRYTVDGEDQRTHERELTPNNIMTQAGVDPATHYLIELRGDHQQESYQNRANEPIRMHNNQRFITASSGPTTVS